jgi:hypothetical protein
MMLSAGGGASDFIFQRPKRGFVDCAEETAASTVRREIQATQVRVFCMAKDTEISLTGQAGAPGRLFELVSALLHS